MIISELLESWSNKFYDDIWNRLNITDRTTIRELFNKVLQLRLVYDIRIERIEGNEFGSADITITNKGEVITFAIGNQISLDDPVLKYPKALRILRHEFSHISQPYQSNMIIDVDSNDKDSIFDYLLHPSERSQWSLDITDMLIHLKITPRDFENIVTTLTRVNTDLSIKELSDTFLNNFVRLGRSLLLNVVHDVDESVREDFDETVSIIGLMAYGLCKAKLTNRSKMVRNQYYLLLKGMYKNHEKLRGLLNRRGILTYQPPQKEHKISKILKIITRQLINPNK